MTTLQEAARKALYALEASIDGDHPYYEDQLTAIESLRTALAQQGEQAKPAAYITDTEQGLMVWTPEMYGEACTYCDDGEFPVPLYTAAPAPQAQQMEPTDDQLVKGVKAMRLFVTKNSVADFKLGYMAALAAAPAPQARTIAQRNVAVVSMFDTQQTAQDVPETNFGNMQPKFLANGTRFKLSFDTRGKVSSLWNFMDELDGRWVALVAAEDDCHLQSSQPVAQPLSVDRITEV